ncbi:hypothetical protein KR093_000550 [Drosophila rubida]|uniref:Chromo domain-containing protein n=1 Tax=Drosophila rubida TaxID=30044 RepID=A0AAD4PMZ3_9MUSC|nr:hypothetical protein KR093_000550 [Drosophila rubida]
MDTKSNDDSGGSDSLDKSMQRKCVMVETTATAATTASITTEPDNCSRDSTALQQEEEQDETAQSGGDSAKANNVTTTTTANAAFETKVKLISQNLKETKLAEETGSDELTTTASATSSNEQEEEQEEAEEEPSGDRVKKVRFHPDAKENDGGNNRVKKKWKSSQNHGGDGANLGCDGMEMDVTDQDEQEEEEEFNLAKTIAEAEDYLKQHPLTFVRRSEEQNGELSVEEISLQMGEDNEEKMIEVDDEDDEDSERDFYKKCQPENGIERVLGKETKAGKKNLMYIAILQVEFLLRFENQGGLSWESEEYIRCMCPTLLKLYEQNRERRQQRLMHHVAKRQSLRQRYTDF